MRLARLLGKLRGPCLRLRLSLIWERRNLLGIRVNDFPNEFHTLLCRRGLSGAGRLSDIFFRFLILDLYRSFLGHPFNSLLIRQSLRHRIIHFSESPDRTFCVPILQAGLYQIYRGRANRFDSFWSQPAQTIKWQAKAIHRLLEYAPGGNAWWSVGGWITITTGPTGAWTMRPRQALLVWAKRKG